MVNLVKLEVYIQIEDLGKLLEMDFDNHNMYITDATSDMEVDVIELGHFEGPYEGKPVEAL